MKLNSDIICQRLGTRYAVDYYNPGRSDLLLSQPEIYINNINHFYENRVYLATVDHLPRRPVIENNVLIICIGAGPVLTYYKEHASVILIRKKVDFYEVYQEIRDLFDAFSEWESRTLAMYMQTPTVQDILNQAAPAFTCPVYVLDASYKYVASINVRNDGFFSRSLDIEEFQQYLEGNEVRLDQRGAFCFNMGSGVYICANLFSQEGQYVGCLYIDKSRETYYEGELKLADYLSHIIEHVCDDNPYLINHAHSSLKQILMCTIDNQPISKIQKTILQTANRKTSFFCLSVHALNRTSSQPVSYLCSMFENMFPGSIFFAHTDSLLGLIPEALLSDEILSGTLSSEKGKNAAFLSLLEEMQLFAGVSNSFRDLYMLRTYYDQAEAALEDGHLYGADSHIHFFSEYVLTELITNAINNQPAEVYFPKGFAELLAHDTEGEVSYLETLRVFLNDNMSYTKASRELFIHRSTLVERIERIQKTLSADLDDPDVRLQLLILLKAIELNRQADQILSRTR